MYAHLQTIKSLQDIHIAENPAFNRLRNLVGDGHQKGFSLTREPMASKHSLIHEDAGVKIIEEIYQVKKSVPEDGLVACHVCAQPLRDGQRCIALAVRRGARSTWLVTHVRCGDHPFALADYTTLGVHERMVSGHIARVMDHRAQQDWPVVLVNAITAVSPARTTKVTIPLRKPRETTETAVAAEERP
jgi:hypothetical protein